VSAVPGAGAIVLVNPRAGGGRAGRMAGHIARELAALAPGVELALPEGIEQARALIRSRPAGSRVVLAGGDGTVQPMLQALVQGQFELGLVPLGSGNDTARALGLHGLGWRDALAQALLGPAAPMDLGECRVEGRAVLFISSLAAGFDAAVGHRALEGPAWLRGLPRYLVATLVELRVLRDAHLRVELDGQVVHEGTSLFASALNSRTYGGGMPAAPDARIDDGRLDALVAGRFGRTATLFMLPRLLAGRHLSHPRVQLRTFQQMRVSSQQPCRLAADGEPAGRACLWEVSVCPGALRAVRRPAQARQSPP
jgi:diacylglycerol kinase (ATP)